MYGAVDWRVDACKAQEPGAPHAMQAQKTGRVYGCGGGRAQPLCQPCSLLLRFI